METSLTTLKIIIYYLFYNNLMFHRVIEDFMIQGGDVNLKEEPSGSFEYLSAIEWSRYGNFSRSKWDIRNDRWFEE